MYQDICEEKRILLIKRDYVTFYTTVKSAPVLEKRETELVKNVKN